MPLLADSVVAPGPAHGKAPVLLLAPAGGGLPQGPHRFRRLPYFRRRGAIPGRRAWIPELLPATHEPEFHSIEFNGVTYRIAAQRIKTAAGELIVELADGSDPRQQWVRSVLLKVLLPNLILVLAAGFAVNWAVTRALKPLIELKDAVERRSPRDLSAIDPLTTPAEVQPLVSALNRLFGLVNDQAEGPAPLRGRRRAPAAHAAGGLQAQVEAWAQAARVAQAGGSDGALTLPADKIIKLRNATRRTSQLANQLLALSRADASAAAAQPMQRVDLKDLCEDPSCRCTWTPPPARALTWAWKPSPPRPWGYEWLLRELLATWWTTPSSTRRPAAR
jgi:two-component system sensor histidine kinase TctE